MAIDVKLIQAAMKQGPWKDQRAVNASVRLRKEDLVVRDGKGFADVHLTDEALERVYRKLTSAYFAGLYNVDRAIKEATKNDPIKPVPPVTKIFIKLQLI